jgi:hypothetical protein
MEERVVTWNWEANRWYWLRLRHAPNAVSGAPDLFARIWPADGETPEPVSWQIGWDYYPLHGARAGSVGLVAPEERAGTELEFDFIFVQDAAAAEVLVRLPALKAKRARLSWLPRAADGRRALSLSGSPYQGYALESTPDFLGWSGAMVFTDVSGWVEIEPAMTEPVGFYRARVVD